MTSKPPDPSRIRALLRRGDPAQEESLTPEQVAQLRQRLAQETLAAPVLLTPRRLAWGALATALLAVVAFQLRGTPAPVRLEPAAATVRQIHFETPGGTRIVWVLSSNLDL